MSPPSPTDCLRIAEKYRVLSSTGVHEPLGDEAFQEFLREIASWSSMWNQWARVNRLKSTLEHRLRLFVPSTSRTLETASQAAWYFDEIFVSNPIDRVVRRPQADIEVLKYDMRRALDRLRSWEPLLSAGVMTLIGKDEHEPPLDTGLVNEIARNLDVRNEILSSIPYLGVDTRKDNLGNDWILSQVEGDFNWSYEAWREQEFTVPAGEQCISPAINIGETLPQVPTGEVLRCRGQDSIVNLCKSEVTGVLKTVVRADSIGAVSLLDATSHAKIASYSDVHCQRAMRDFEPYKALLPHLTGVSPEVLVRLREEHSSAFLDLRNELRATTLECVRDGRPREETDIALQRVISPKLRKLEAEMVALSKSTRIKGWGGAMVGTAAMISGMAYALPAVVIGGLTAGLAASLNAFAGSKKGRAEAAGHPLFFLWLAQTT